MKPFLWWYISSKDGWIASSLQVVHAAEHGSWLAKQLRLWSQAYINDCKCLPVNQYGCWNVSLLEDKIKWLSAPTLPYLVSHVYLSAQQVPSARTKRLPDIH